MVKIYAMFLIHPPCQCSHLPRLSTKPVLTNIAKCHNVQLPLEANREVLLTLIASHLSYGDCINSDANGCRQVITSFCSESDVLSVLTKFTFQIQILSSILYLVRQ